MNNLAIIFASFIIDGDIQFKDVPEQLKPLVKEVLVKKGLGKLAE